MHHSINVRLLISIKHTSHGATMMAMMSSHASNFTRVTTSLLTIIPVRSLDWKQWLIIIILFCTYSFMLSFPERSWYVAPKQLLISSSCGLKWNRAQDAENSKQNIFQLPTRIRSFAATGWWGESGGLPQKPVCFLWFVDSKALKWWLLKKKV